MRLIFSDAIRAGKIRGPVVIYIQRAANPFAQRVVFIQHRREARLRHTYQLAKQIVSALRGHRATAEGGPLLMEDPARKVAVTLRPARPGLGKLPQAATAKIVDAIVVNRLNPGRAHLPLRLPIRKGLAHRDSGRGWPVC